MSIFDLAWLPMPEQQQFPPADGHEGAGHGGSGDYGGGDDGGDGGPGPEDPSEGFSGVGGAADSPARGGPMGGDEGDGGGIVGYVSQALTDMARDVKSFKQDTGVYPGGILTGIAVTIGPIAERIGEQIGNEFRSLFGDEEDRFPDAFGKEGHQEGRGGADKPVRGPGGGTLTKTREEAEEAAWGSEEYRTKAREALERMLGDMPDDVYETPDWPVCVAQAAPRPVRTQPMPPPIDAMQVAQRTIYEEMVEFLDEEEK